MWLSTSDCYFLLKLGVNFSIFQSFEHERLYYIFWVFPFAFPMWNLSSNMDKRQQKIEPKENFYEKLQFLHFFSKLTSNCDNFDEPKYCEPKIMFEHFKTLISKTPNLSKVLSPFLTLKMIQIQRKNFCFSYCALSLSYI